MLVDRDVHQVGSAEPAQFPPAGYAPVVVECPRLARDDTELASHVLLEAHHQSSVALHDAVDDPLDAVEGLQAWILLVVGVAVVVLPPADVLLEQRVGHRHEEELLWGSSGARVRGRCSHRRAHVARQRARLPGRRGCPSGCCV